MLENPVLTLQVNLVAHKKLDKKAQKLRFIGYTGTANNYKVWDEEKHKSYVRHDVIFNENDFGKSTDAN